MKNIGKLIFSVTILSMLAKVLTLFSRIYLTASFGTAGFYEIYNFSIMLPNIIFTIIGTSLTTIIVPVYSSLLSKNENEKAKNFIDDILTLSILFALTIILCIYFIAPFLINNFSSYGANQDEFKFAIFAVRTLIPIMLFYTLKDIFAGILQSHHKFFALSIMTLPTSIIIILYVIFFSKTYGVRGLIFASLIAYSSQAFFLMLPLKSTGYKYKISLNLKNKDMINAIKLSPSVLLGVSAYQINMLYNLSMGTQFKTLVIMDTVQQIMLMPTLILISSVSSIYFPKLSSEWVYEDKTQYKKSLETTFYTILFFLIPASIGFFTLRYNLIFLLVKWGKVTSNDINIGSNILAIYSFGIVFIGLKETLDKAFYSQKRTLPSGIVGILIMIVNVLISQLLKNKFGTYSMPIAFSTSVMVGSVILFLYLIKIIGNFSTSFYTNMLKSFISSCIMGLVVIFTIKILGESSFIISSSIIGRLINVFVPIFFGGITYFSCTYLLKVSYSVIFVGKILSVIKGVKKS